MRVGGDNKRGEDIRILLNRMLCHVSSIFVSQTSKLVISENQDLQSGLERVHSSYESPHPNLSR